MPRDLQDYPTLRRYDNYSKEHLNRVQREERDKILEHQAGEIPQQIQESYSVWEDDSWWNARRDTSNRIGTVLYRGTQNSGIPGMDHISFYGGKLTYYSIVAYIMLVIWSIKITLSFAGYTLYWLFLGIEKLVSVSTSSSGEIPLVTNQSSQKSNRYYSVDIDPR